MRGIGRLRRWAKRIVPQATILLYHRVAEVPADPQLLCVSPKHFAEHLEVLRRYYHPLSLASLRRRLAFNFWPLRSVVITFDDGYADNLHNALPLLEAADVPATVFAVAGQLHSRREFWWDDLERILLSPPMLPDQLSLTVDGRPYAWHFKPLHGVDCSDQRWHVLMESEPTPRQTAYLELAGLLRRMDYEARERLLARLAAWAGLAAEGRPAYRALTTDEMNALAHDGLVEVGAHTMTHPMLSTLAGKTQRAEIVGSKRRLEEALDRPVTSFSYPYGSRSDYTRDVVEMVKEAGFRCACSNFAGAVMLGRDPYQLPRFLVRDWDGDEFARRLTDWFVG